MFADFVIGMASGDQQGDGKFRMRQLFFHVQQFGRLDPVGIELLCFHQLELALFAGVVQVQGETGKQHLFCHRLADIIDGAQPETVRFTV